MYRLTDVTKDYPKGRGVVHALQSPMSCRIMAPVSMTPSARLPCRRRFGCLPHSVSCRGKDRNCWTARNAPGPR
jgi:hypothetical protein